jgi:hypothetical protein
MVGAASRMKTAWAILLISAITDMLISSGTAISAAMVATGSTVMPTTPVIVLSLIGGIVAFARTIQQGLKTAVEMKAESTNVPAPKVI